ncbi:hypothetical protein GEMRC1_005825 [Eukaryota sp. GEM-RC1]
MGCSSSIPVQQITDQPQDLTHLRNFLFVDNSGCASEVLQISDDSIVQICQKWDLDELVSEIVKGFNLFKDHPESKVVTQPSAKDSSEPSANDSSSLWTPEEVAFWIGTKFFLSQQSSNLDRISHSPLLLFEPNSNRICTPFKGELLRNIKPLSEHQPMSFSFTPVSDETSSDPSDSQSLSDLLLTSFASFTTTVFKILSHPDNSFLINTPCHPLYHIEDELNPTSITKKLSSIFLFLLVKTTTSSSFLSFSALSKSLKVPSFFSFSFPNFPRPLKRLKVSRDMLDFDQNQPINCDLIDEMVVESLKDLSLIDSLLFDSSKSTLIDQLMPKLFNITVFSINSSNCSDSSLIKSFTDNFLPLTDSFIYIQAESYVKTVDYVHVVTSKFVISLETPFNHLLFSPLRDILISKDLVKIFNGINCELVDLLHYFFSILKMLLNILKNISKSSEIDDLYYKCRLVKDKNFSEVNRIPYDSRFEFDPDYLKLIEQREPLISYLGDKEASMIPSHITVDTEPQYKSPLGVTVCSILDEFPKVEGVVVRFELSRALMEDRILKMCQDINHFHNFFSVEVTRVDAIAVISFTCANYHQLFALESLVNGDVFSDMKYVIYLLLGRVRQLFFQLTFTISKFWR